MVGHCHFKSFTGSTVAQVIPHPQHQLTDHMTGDHLTSGIMQQTFTDEDFQNLRLCHNRESQQITSNKEKNENEASKSNSVVLI